MDENDLINEDDIEEVIELDDEDMLDVEDVEDDYDEAENPCVPIQDDSVLKFSKHTGSVFCCDIDKSSSYAVTGGEDDKAYLWNISNGDVIMECLGHSDSVTCVGFNNDSTLFATGDMAGKIKIWSLEKKSELLELETGDLCWMLWHNQVNVLVAGTNDGSMWMWKIPSGECKHYPGAGKINCVGHLLSDGKSAVSGYEDGTLKIWDLKSAEPVHSISGINAHKGNITCLDSDSGVTLATGSIDSTSKLININSGKILTTFTCGTAAVNEDSPDSVESIAFCQNQPILATGTVDGNLGIWDLTKQISRFNCKQESGITKLLWESVDNQSSRSVLYTAGLDGIVRLWDTRTGANELQWKGHKADILDMSLSPDMKFILTASDDETSRIFSLSSAER